MGAAVDQWIIDIDRKLRNVHPTREDRKRSQCCITRVPKVMKDLYNIDVFTPTLVSFGPYHHGKEELRVMEEHKLITLSKYLTRSGITLEALAQELKPHVPDIMMWYDGLQEEPWTNPDRFMELMILDGCFLLENLIWESVDFLTPYHSFIETDMFRLENQLPLPVLVMLIRMGGNQEKDAAKFMKYFGWDEDDESRPDMNEAGQHILNLHKSFSMTDTGNYFYDLQYKVPPVTDLIKTGVRIRQDGRESLSDIEFSKGTLTLPILDTKRFNKDYFLNCLAYEQLFPRIAETKISAYVFLMEDLIDTARDVELLRQKGIIKGEGSDDEITTLFNNLSKGIDVIEQHNKSENVNRKLNEYRNIKWHRWLASFRKSYLSNPWVFSSLVGAIILLLLTITQTVYIVMTYYYRKP